MGTVEVISIIKFCSKCKRQVHTLGAVVKPACWSSRITGKLEAHTETKIALNPLNFFVNFNHVKLFFGQNWNQCEITKCLIYWKFAFAKMHANIIVHANDDTDLLRGHNWGCVGQTGKIKCTVHLEHLVEWIQIHSCLHNIGVGKMQIDYFAGNMTKAENTIFFHHYLAPLKGMY